MMQYHYAKIGCGVSEYLTNRSGVIPEGLIKMQSPPPHYNWIANKDGTYSEIEKSDSELSKIEYDWAKKEIESITEQLEKHADNSSRAIATEQEWRNYREELREYASVDEDGVYSLRTEKPARPS